eukprot:CAMPEP_0197247582 /NCGR_PEP_ID=MMETSP1429-20130617/29418_1 /TAXON_ID=49237 /ORGANISM="Chaetoceros  sp., Strain UNC1202" /LENGTH=388 /DNA_ID=CAMNT_0042708521 /DNA_START=135 /DNA_END=1301 /DNA_ORIENTATION=+
MPTGISDFTATYFDGKITTSDDKDHSRSIVLLGGCSDENGNKWVGEGDYPGFYCMDFTNEATVFFPATQEFSSIQGMPEERTQHSTVAVDGKLYVIGGRDKNQALISNVIVFDPENQQWSEYITLDGNHEVSDHGSVARDGLIYVFGGYTSGYEAKTSTFSINTKDGGKIKDLEPLPTGRGDIAAVHYDHGSIDGAYVIGGFTHVNNFCAPFATVERYDFKSDSWMVSKTTTDLGKERGDKAAVVMDKMILSIGGEDKHEDMCSEASGTALDPFQHSVGIDEIESFNPRKGDEGWQYESNLPEIRFRTAAAVDEKENVLYVFGGQKAYNAQCDCYKTSDKIFTFEGEKGGLSTTAIVLISGACVAVFLSIAGYCFCVRKPSEIEAVSA